MTKKDKLRAKLFKIPPPKDFRWDDLVTLMNQCGFAELCGGGSHYCFKHTSGFELSGVPKPHPNGILLRYMIDKAKAAILYVEECTDENE